MILSAALLRVKSRQMPGRLKLPFACLTKGTPCRLSHVIVKKSPAVWMTRSCVSKINRELILRIFFAGLFIASSIYQIRFGANCDVALQVSWSSRTARGDFPLVDIWGPFCVSSWLVGFIYRVVYLFDEYFTYTFLVLKILGVAIQTIISIYFYYVIRKSLYVYNLGINDKYLIT